MPRWPSPHSIPLSKKLEPERQKVTTTIVTDDLVRDVKEPDEEVLSFFLYNSHPFYILPSEIDLRKNPHLRLLQFRFSFEDKKTRDSQDDVIRWFNSICESMTSKSLVVGLYGLINELEICNKIQDTLLALCERIETFSVHLTKPKKDKGLFSKLYEAGIVVEKLLNEDEEVSSYLLTSKLLY